MQVLICIEAKNQMKQTQDYIETETGIREATGGGLSVIELQSIHRLWKCHDEIHYCA